MKNSISAIRPSVANQEVEWVGTQKLLAVMTSNDLTWNNHIENAIANAIKGLYALRLSKRAGIMLEDMLKVYICNIRSLLEYASQVWQDIPAYLTLLKLYKEVLKE